MRRGSCGLSDAKSWGEDKLHGERHHLLVGECDPRKWPVEINGEKRDVPAPRLSLWRPLSYRKAVMGCSLQQS
jgi:hypothetical protein